MSKDWKTIASYQIELQIDRELTDNQKEDLEAALDTLEIGRVILQTAKRELAGYGGAVAGVRVINAHDE